MADTHDNAPSERELTMLLPPAQRLLSVAETVELLAASDPHEGLLWYVRIVDAARQGRLRVRYENGLTVQPGTIGADYGMGTHFLCSDVAAWLQEEGWAVTFAVAHGKKARPLQVSVQQEQEILRTIRTLGFDPLALPARKKGEAGVKAKVRESLPFSIRVFDKAWQRLRANRAIGEKAKASLLPKVGGEGTLAEEDTPHG